MKDCGDCSLCCKFLEIPSLGKKADVWCPHCRPGTKHPCRIYDERPDDCRNFHCFWRAEGWPDWLRPDRCGVLFEALPGVFTVLVTTGRVRPDAWKTTRIVGVAAKLKDKGRPVIIRTKNDTLFFIPKGWTHDAIMKELKTVLDRETK